MKKTKFFATLLAALTVFATLAGCGKERADDEFVVGVIQFGSHPSLDNVYAGIKDYLEEALGEKLSIDFQNGNFEPQTCDNIAKNMVSKGHDLIIAIATPAAMSAYAATKDSNVPLVFSAVSDPVSAGLVGSLEAPGSHATGTSDVLNLPAQLKLIRALQPDAKKIGILYTTNEENSLSHLKEIKKLAPEYGFEIVEQGVQSAADVPQAAASLIPKVDCLNNFTDNNVVHNLGAVLEQANAAGIPIYGSEEEQVYNGCLAAEGLDYVALGRATGELAEKVLKGEKPAELPVVTFKETAPIVNEDVLAALKLTLPESYASARLVNGNQK